MVSFQELLAEFEWREIRNCPGRYCARNLSPTCTVSELLGADIPEHPIASSRARDPVILTPLEGGGLISYKRSDGTYLHTLNTPDGYLRKCAELGV